MLSNIELLSRGLPPGNVPKPVEITSEENEFLIYLHRKKKVIFDWGCHLLWVIKGDDESKVEDQLHIWADRYVDIVQAIAFTSADTAYALMYRGFEVDIRNAGVSFKTPDELKTFIQEIKDMIEEGKRAGISNTK